MVIMAVVVIMMMINLVVLKIRLISGTKLENDGERIASYNQVFPDIKRFFSFSTILTILLQQWPGYLEANERTWWLLKRPMKIRDPRFVSRQDLLKELTCSGGKNDFSSLKCYSSSLDDINSVKMIKHSFPILQALESVSK